MKIKNNTPANISVSSKSSRGQAAKQYMIVLGESTLELDDNVWLKEYAEATAPILEAGNLEIVEPAKLTEEEATQVKEDALEAARKLIAESEVKVEVKAPS